MWCDVIRAHMILLCCCGKPVGASLFKPDSLSTSLVCTLTCYGVVLRAFEGTTLHMHAIDGKATT